MILDGKKIAEEILVTLQKERETLPRAPRLGIVVGNQDPVTASFVRLKESVARRLGVVVVRETLAVGTTLERALIVVEQLCRTCDGVLVQLPLASGMDTDMLLSALDPARDIDGINPHTKEFERVVGAPVAEAIATVLTQVNADIRGKKAVVVGTGRLVGAPAAAYLKSRGASVFIVTKTQGSLDELKDADIVILGAGEPGLVVPGMLREGVILIDGGTSDLPVSLSGEGGQKSKIVGDADPACAEVASVFTPVPGGIGPITVAMLFKNLFELTQRHR
jgi:methylenetetrahydrofolate dehydrogenase (NADP+) / methenyltetrahydrofolate cyclohydrolase